MIDPETRDPNELAYRAAVVVRYLISQCSTRADAEDMATLILNDNAKEIMRNFLGYRELKP